VEDAWRWLWLAAAGIFAIGEMASPGSFFLLPFAIGAAVAALLAFLDVSVVIQFIVFVGISLGSLALLRPVARRLDRDEPTEGIGAKRLIGERALVLEAIPGHHDSGLVRVGREEWKAETSDGSPIPEGTTVKIVEVRGTRVVVFPTEPPALGAEAD
jgi:membrane protein implicated in regulation of membrane protease activity